MSSQYEALLKILRFLKDNGPMCNNFEYCDLTPLGEQEGWDRDRLWGYMLMLNKSGHIEIDPEFGVPELGACLTEKGLAAVEPDNPLVRDFAGGVNVAGNLYGAGVATGHATVSVRVDAVHFLKELREAILDAPDIPQRERRSLQDAVDKLTQNPTVVAIIQGILNLFG